MTHTKTFVLGERVRVVGGKYDCWVGRVVESNGHDGLCLSIDGAGLFDIDDFELERLAESHWRYGR